MKAALVQTAQERDSLKAALKAKVEIPSVSPAIINDV